MSRPPREIFAHRSSCSSLFHLDDALLLDVHEEEVADDGGDAEEGEAGPDVQDGVLQVELAPAALDRDDELKRNRCLNLMRRGNQIHSVDVWLRKRIWEP